jgi:hypothetical protein
MPFEGDQQLVPRLERRPDAPDEVADGESPGKRLAVQLQEIGGSLSPR